MGEPSANYDAGYEQPSYATGASSYEASAPGYGEVETATGGFDLSTLLVPILIIAGLALLFPSVRNVPVSRRRREAGDSTENPCWNGYRTSTWRWWRARSAWSPWPARLGASLPTPEST